MKLLVAIYILLALSSCSPVERDEYKTNYPDTPTMQSAEDAMTGELFNE